MSYATSYAMPSAMPRRLPRVALLLGIAGLIPFVAGGVASLQETDVERAALYLRGLIDYGAVILAFLGGVHWGLVLASPAPEGAAIITRREPYRLVLGVVPSLVGWGALLLSLIGLPLVALAVLLVGFIAFTTVEAELKRRTLVPAGYMWLRLGLSIVVVLVLGTVLTLRLIGAHIIL